MLDTIEMDERIEKCEKILKENPQSQIFAALADVLRKKGELDQAFRICRQGLRLHPDYGTGRLIMARICFDRKMYDWAEQELEEAIRIDGRTRSTDLLEIEILIERGFFSKAKVILDKLRAFEPVNEFYRSLEDRITIGRAEKQAKLAEAEEFYRTRVKERKAEELGKISDIALVDETLTYEEGYELVSGFPNVEAAFYMSSDGVVDRSMVPERADLDSCSEALAEVGRLVASAIGTVGIGCWTEILIETEKDKFLLLSLGDRILVALCKPDVNLGSLKLKLQKIAKSLWKE